MKTHQVLNQLCSAELQRTPISGTDVLQALAEQHETLEQSWTRLLERLPGASPTELTEAILDMDREIGGYKRQLSFLRHNLRMRSNS